MILTGDEIERRRRKGEVLIEPFDPTNLGPNSYDLTLSPDISFYPGQDGLVLDPASGSMPKLVTETITDEGFVLQPGRLYLAHSVERAGSTKFVPMVEGRSSMARCGVRIHQTGGFGDIGFLGQWTLEIDCLIRFKIYPGMRIAQVYFHRVLGSQKVDYGQRAASKYRGENAKGAVGTQIGQDREFG